MTSPGATSRRYRSVTASDEWPSWSRIIGMGTTPSVTSSLLTFYGPLSQPMENQIRSGELTRLPEADIRRWMAGELG